MEENRVYSTIFSIVQLISIPAMGCIIFRHPLSEKHIAEKTIKDRYLLQKKTSLSLFFRVWSCFLALRLAILTLPNLCPKAGKIFARKPLIWVVVLHCFSNMATGFNGHIISMSFYRFNIYVMLFLAVLTTVLNFILFPAKLL